MERLRVADFVGHEWMQAECDALGITGDAAACARFDTAFRDALAEVGCRNANALKVASGLGYDTCQKLLVEPRKQSRRVLWVVCSNVDVSLVDIEHAALYDADAEGFDLEYRTAVTQMVVLLDAFLQLDARERSQVNKRIRATVGRYPADGTQEVAARDLLREQLEPLLSLRPDRRLEVVDADGYFDGDRVRWSGADADSVNGA